MIRAGIVGLGWWGKHMVWRMQDSGVLRIVRAVEPNPANAGFAGEHGIALAPDYGALLADLEIDAVILCTPHGTHTAQVTAAAAHGKHVFCEKPLALSRADATRSVEACQDAGVVLGIGHERRYEPGMVEIRRLVTSGELGTIMHAEANFSHDKLANVPKGDWRTSKSDAPAAGMTAMGIHLTDAMIDLFGEVTEVFAATTSRVAYPQNGDVVSAHMRFSSGVTGYVNAILVTPLYLRFTVFGSEAWAELRNHTHPDTEGPSTLTLHRRDGTSDSRRYDWTDTVRANLERFARTIEAGEPYPFTPAQMIANIAALEAICRSAAERNRVEVAPVTVG